jgi:RecB family endonuclease NucS
MEELEAKYVWRVSEGGEGLPYEENLEHYIVNVLSSVEDGLTLYQSGRWNGIRCSTEVGTVDLWCVDRQGNFVVIELKRNQTADHAIGQLARYIGWVEENHPDREVRGIIICKKTSNRLRLAAKALRAAVFEYEVAIVDAAGQPILRLTRM